VFLHAQIVNETVFIVSLFNYRDEMTIIYAYKTLKV